MRATLVECLNWKFVPLGRLKTTQKPSDNENRLKLSRLSIWSFCCRRCQGERCLAEDLALAAVRPQTDRQRHVRLHLRKLLRSDALYWGKPIRSAFLNGAKYGLWLLNFKAPKTVFETLDISLSYQSLFFFVFRISLLNSSVCYIQEKNINYKMT